MSHLGKAFYVEDTTARVTDGLAEEALGVGAEFCLYALVVPILVNEGAFYTKFLQGNTEEVEGATIYIIGGDEVVACLTDIEDCIEVGGLTRRGQHGTHTALEGSNLLCHGIVGGVGQTGVEITSILKVKELGHLVACLITEGGTLIDGQLLGFALGCFPTAMYAECF